MQSLGLDPDIDHENEQQQDLKEQQQKILDAELLEQAAYEVEVFENHLTMIQSVHKQCRPRMDWGEIAVSTQPEKPEPNNVNELKAQASVNEYQPSFLDRLFRLEEKKRNKLFDAVTSAAEQDQKDYEQALDIWKINVESWIHQKKIARSMLQGKFSAKLEAIDKLQPFSEIGNLGSGLSLSSLDHGLLGAKIHVYDTDIVPKQSKTLLKHGRLSVRPMPKRKFNEIYQNYVCSCVLRVANELFSILIDKLIVVTAVSHLLNTATGHLEETPILSVVVSRKTMDKLNLDNVVPADAMDNFIHQMAFKKTTGFRPVGVVDVKNLMIEKIVN